MSLITLELENKYLKEKIIKLELIIKIQMERCESCGKTKHDTCDYCGKDIIIVDSTCEKCGKNGKMYHHSTTDDCEELCETCSKGNCPKKEREHCYICRYDSDETF
jgi:hypothetical protein